MSKRLIRIYPKNVFDKLRNEIGLEVNAVMQNGRTYFGKIDSVTENHLNISDTRDHLHQLAISDLYEVVYDFENQKRPSLFE